MAADMRPPGSITPRIRTAILAIAPAVLSLIAGGCVDLTHPSRLGVQSALPDAGLAIPDSAPDRGARDTELPPPPFDLGGPTDVPTPPDDAPITPGPSPDSLPPAVDVPADVPMTTPADARPDTRPDAPDAPTSAGNGSACATGSACQSGACVDGVCCENSCTSVCSACNLPGQAGLCWPIAAGADPGNECAASAPASCGLDGFCNGAGACRQHVAGTTCTAGSCTGSTATNTATCDGIGHCGAAGTHECSPYLCGAGTCRTSCTAMTDCKAGYVCTSMACVPATPPPDAGAPDTAPPTGTVLLVDDFSDATLTRNTMGGAVTWDNQTVALASGGVQFTWNGRDSYNDFIETFLQSFCAYDIRAFRTLRFRMSASTGPRTVNIFLPRSNSTCATAATPLGGTFNVTTTMTTYDVDISATVRDKALFIEFAPVELDNTTYLLDDVQLIQ
jgi:hypothetical protein